MPHVVAFAEAAVPAGLRAHVLALQAQAFGGPAPAALDAGAQVPGLELYPGPIDRLW